MSNYLPAVEVGGEVRVLDSFNCYEEEKEEEVICQKKGAAADDSAGNSSCGSSSSGTYFTVNENEEGKKDM